MSDDLTETRAAPPRVAVIVVDYDGGDDVVECVRALLGTDWPAGRLHVIVVDNASSDGSASRAAALDPARVRVVRSATNLGFAGGSALGLRHLGGDDDVVALVNPDAFVTPGWLAPLVAALADERVGAACPKLLLASVPSDDGPPRINNAGSLVRADGYGVERGFGEVDEGQYDVAADTFAWTGGCVLLSRPYLHDVGGFDERLFLYYEDTDLAWRGRLRGWRYRYVPASVVHHRLGASTGAGAGGSIHARYSERNRLVVLAKVAPAGLALRQWLRFPLSTASYAFARLRGRYDLAPRGMVTSRLRALGGALLLLPHALFARRGIRRQATVGDAAIRAELVG